MPDVTDGEHQSAAVTLRELMGAYRDHEDLISIGAYRRGGNRRVDVAIELQERLNAYLKQRVEEPATPADARAGILRLGQEAAQISARLEQQSRQVQPQPQVRTTQQR
jgi:flagellum-specific ATP synthase